MGCHGNHEISYDQRSFIFRTIFFAFKWPHCTNLHHNEMSYVFNLGQITPLDTSLPNVFSLLFKISLIFMNMQMRYFHIGPLGERTYQIVSLII